MEEIELIEPKIEYSEDIMAFRAIEKSDLAIIRKYTQKCGIQSCDFTLCGIYLRSRT